MVIGILRLVVHIPEAHSLKERRSVIRPIVERIRSKFHVSIAEVGDLERWQIATLAMAVVSNDRAFVNEILDHIVSSVSSAGTVIITNREMSIESYNDNEPL